MALAPWLSRPALVHEGADSETEQWVVLNNELVPKSFLSRSTIPTRWFVEQDSSSQAPEKPTRWCFVNGSVAAFTPAVSREIGTLCVKEEPADHEECKTEVQVEEESGGEEGGKRLRRSVQRPRWLDTYNTDMPSLRTPRTAPHSQPSHSPTYTKTKTSISEKSHKVEDIGKVAEVKMEPVFAGGLLPVKTEDEQDTYQDNEYNYSTDYNPVTVTSKLPVDSPNPSPEKKTLRRKVQKPQWLETYCTNIQPLRKDSSSSSCPEETVKSTSVDYDSHAATDSGVEMKEVSGVDDWGECDHKLQPAPQSGPPPPHAPQRGPPASHHRPPLSKRKATQQSKQSLSKLKKKMKYRRKLDIPRPVPTLAALERKFVRRVQKPQWLATYDSNLQSLRAPADTLAKSTAIPAGLKKEKDKSSQGGREKRPSKVQPPPAKKRHTPSPRAMREQGVEAETLKQGSPGRCQQCHKMLTALQSGQKIDVSRLCPQHDLHTQVQAFFCSICKKMFKTVANLRRHVTLAHQQQQQLHSRSSQASSSDNTRALLYGCTLCLDRFSRKDRLRKHYQHKHKTGKPV